jgi:DMSO/TMAO reductase YedYZ molybdopterin-dependent catalytic subunit
MHSRSPGCKHSHANRRGECVKFENDARGLIVNSVKLEPNTFFRRIPLAPHQMRDRVTRTEDAIVLCHLGVPRLDRDQWSLTIDGLVEHPLALRFADLLRYPKTEVASFHQCAGSPLQPFEPTRRVCNVTWGGARLVDLLADCRPSPAARYVWSRGADFGEFSGVAVDAYTKDMPIARVAADVLIAYEMNGNALAAEHGFPARLVVPGFYGTNSVKWLVGITLAESRATGPFTTRWYNDPLLDSAGHETGATTPVWAIAPESLIVSPAPGARIEASVEREIWGWAWADSGVASVEVRAGDQAAWRPAELEPPRGREWQRFSISWSPQHPGAATLASRATSKAGIVQPMSGRRNAVHGVPVNIV